MQIKQKYEDSLFFERTKQKLRKTPKLGRNERKVNLTLKSHIIQGCLDIKGSESAFQVYTKLLGTNKTKRTQPGVNLAPNYLESSLDLEEGTESTPGGEEARTKSLEEQAGDVAINGYEGIQVSDKEKQRFTAVDGIASTSNLISGRIKPPPNSTILDKKTRHKIRVIKKAIRDETAYSRKRNSMILRGLKQALHKLQNSGCSLVATSRLQQEDRLVSSSQGEISTPNFGSSEAITPAQKKDELTSQPRREDFGQTTPEATTLLQQGTVLDRGFEKDSAGSKQPEPSTEQDETISSVLKETPKASAEIEASLHIVNHIESMAVDMSNGNIEESLESQEGLPDDYEMNNDINATIYPLTDECKHYTQRNEVLWDIQK